MFIPKRHEKRGSKVHSLGCFIFQRMCDWELWVWVITFSILGLYIVSRFDSINLTAIQNYVNLFLSWFKQHKLAIDSWTYSYITGILIYFLTVTYPHAKRSQIILPKLCDKVRLFKDDFRELSFALCNKDWCEDDFIPKNEIDMIKHYGKNPNNNTYYSLNFCFPILKSKIDAFDSYADYILNHQEELSNYEIKILLEVRHSSIFDKIRTKEIATPLLDENDLINFIEELREENKKIINVYDEMCNRCFKRKCKKDSNV